MLCRFFWKLANGALPNARNFSFLAQPDHQEAVGAHQGFAPYTDVRVATATLTLDAAQTKYGEKLMLKRYLYLNLLNYITLLHVK